MRGSGGFTLVEVLVALGLLVLLAALALPTALTNTDGARARSAERMLRLAPAVARAEAQRLGSPVGLVLTPSPAGEGLAVAIVREPDPGSDNARDLAADPEDVATWPTVAQPRALPRGTRLWQGETDALDDLRADADERAPGFEDASDLDAAFAVPRELLDEAAAGASFDQTPRAVVIAWFASDGSAVAGESAAIRLADDRVLRLRVRALAGTLAFDAIETEPPASPAGEAVDGRADDRADDQMDDGSTGAAPAGRDGATAVPGDQPVFDEPFFDEPAFDELGFDEPGFDEPAFDELGFDELEFEDRASAFDRRQAPARGSASSDRGDGASRDVRREPAPQPQPPQPR